MERRRLLTTFANGDVLIAEQGLVDWRTHDGNMVGTIPIGPPAFQNTGMAFDQTGHLEVTNFTANTITRVDSSGHVVATFGGSAIPAGSHPESLAFDRNGDIFVGLADGGGKILKLDPTGKLLATFVARTEDRGTDWLELEPDQHTLVYTSEGQGVHRFDTATGLQLPDLISNLPGAHAYALRLLADGSVLVADSSSVVMLDASGRIVRQFTSPGGNDTALFALSLDPDGKTFWTADYQSRDVLRFDLATGQVITQFRASNPGVGGLVVKGEIVQALTQSADLGIAAVDPPSSGLVGHNLTFTYLITNAGPNAATDAVLHLSLPAGLNFVDASLGAKVSGGDVSIPQGLLGPGSKTKVTVIALPTSAAPKLTTVAQVFSPVSDPSPGNNSVGITVTVYSPPPPTPPPPPPPPPQPPPPPPPLPPRAIAPWVIGWARFGFHWRSTTLLLRFRGPIDPATAGNPEEYTIRVMNGRRPGARTIRVGRAVYDPQSDTVALEPVRRLDFHRNYLLTVNGLPPSGLKGPSGAFLDGAGVSHPGTNYSAVLHGFGSVSAGETPFFPRLARTLPSRRR